MLAPYTQCSPADWDVHHGGPAEPRCERVVSERCPGWQAGDRDPPRRCPATGAAWLTAEGPHRNSWWGPCICLSSLQAMSRPHTWAQPSDAGTKPTAGVSDSERQRGLGSPSRQTRPEPPSPGRQLWEPCPKLPCNSDRGLLWAGSCPRYSSVGVLTPSS